MRKHKIEEFLTGLLLEFVGSNIQLLLILLRKYTEFSIGRDDEISRFVHSRRLEDLTFVEKILERFCP